jgi:hypothetical protein
MGEKIVEAATLTKDNNCIGASKLVVFCNAVDDNPFMAGAFHGVGEADVVINIGVCGPGVVRAAISKTSKIPERISLFALLILFFCLLLIFFPQFISQFSTLLILAPKDDNVFSNSQ